MKTVCIGFLLAPLFFSAAALAGRPEECQKIIIAVAKLKDAHPQLFDGYIGKNLAEFPCEEAGGEGSGALHSVRTFNLGLRTAVFLTKDLGEHEHSIVLDAVLLPKIAKGERYWGTSQCTHIVPKAPAIALGKARKAGSRLSKAWVIDREVGIILPVPPSAVKCEEDKEAIP